MKKLSIIFVLALIMALVIGVLVPLSHPSPVVSQPVRYDDLVVFLGDDDVNTHVDNPLTYNCLNRALDLWHNAYLKGIDAFIVVLNEDGVNWHCRVGFYATERADLPYLEAGYTSYWGDTVRWFYVEPLVDCILTRAVIENSSPEQSITILSGQECLRLWSMGNSILPNLYIGGIVAKYKIGRLIL